MKFSATVKVVNEVKSGISASTGNNYQYQSIVLETPDGDHTARWLAGLGTKQVESFKQQGIKVGDQVIVDLSFQTMLNYNKFVDNKVYVIEIARVQTPQPPLGGAGMGEASQHQYPQIGYPKF